MPLYTASLGVRMVYAECNHPAGTGADDPLPWDTYYDKDQNDITSTKDAALAFLGLSVTGDVFTATLGIVLALTLSYSPLTAPGGQMSTIRFNTAGYIADPRAVWGTGSLENNPPSNFAQTLELVLVLNVGETFKVRTLVSGGTDPVIDYATMSIIRLA